MSAVLETFFILFDSNSDKLKKGVDDADKSTKGLQEFSGVADAAGVAMGEHLVATFAEIGTAFLAAFSAERIAGLVTETADYNAQLAINSDRLGESVEDLDAWQKATEHAGGTATGFIGTLDFLNKGLAGLHTPGGVSRLKPFLEELKIDPKKVTDSLQLLGLLSDKAKALGAQNFSGIAERFGIDPGTQLLIAKGNAELQEQIRHEKELGVVTHAQADEARKYKQAQDDLNHEFERVATTIGGAVLPMLISLFDHIGTIITYLSAHKGLIEGFFIGVAGVITTIYLPAITAAAAETLAAILPWLLMAAAVIAVGAAVAFLVDDIQNFLDGNNSVIGEISKTWPVVGEVVRAAVTGIGDALRWFGQLASGVFDFVGSLWNFIVASIVTGVDKLLAKFPFLGTVLKGVAEGIVLALRAVVDIIEHILGLLAKLPAFLHFEAKGLKEATDTVKKADTKPKPAPGQSLDDFTKAAFNAPGFGGAPAPLALLGRFKAASTPELPPVPASAAQPAVQSGHLIPPEVAKNVAQAQAAVSVADKSPLSALAGHTINQRQGDRVYKFTVENLTVQAPNGTNPDDFAHAIRGHLEDQMHQAMDHFDDGVQG